MTDPIITVQLTTYNRPVLVQRAINSLLAQTYPHIRILVCDNGSNDESRSVVQSLAGRDDRIIYSYYKDNKEGANNVLNEIKKIDTPFFSFLSDDDWLLPNFFEDALKEFERHPDCGYVSLATRIVDLAGHTIRKPAHYQRWAGYYKPPQGAVMILQGGVVNYTGILFRKELLKNIGLWNNICVVNDVVFELAGALEFPVYISSTEGAVFTHHNESLSTITPLHFVWPCYLERIAALTKYCDHHPQIKEYITSKLFQRLKSRLLWTGIAWLYRREPQTTKRIIQILREQFGYQKPDCWILAFFYLSYCLQRGITVSMLKGIIESKPQIVALIDYVG